MSRTRKLRRSAGYAFASALLASALAVVVNLATEWKHNLAAWIVVAALTILTAATTFLLMRDAPESPRTNDLSFGHRLRAGRVRVKGRRNRFTAGDDATITDLDVSSGG
ncbi:hypothetical protein [Actinophytocola sediminis]